MLRILPAYAAILALGYVYLAVRVIRARRAGKVPLGTGGNPAIERAMRVHANFAEYVPLALLLIAFVELTGGAWWLVHLLAITLVVARAAHAFGVAREPEDFRFRVAGTASTFGVLIVASLALLASTFIGGPPVP